MSGLDVASAIFSVISLLSKAAVYGDQLGGAAEEMQIARELVSTITAAVSDVSAERLRLSHLIRASQKARIDETVDRTKRLIDLVNECVKTDEQVKKSSSVRKAGVVVSWVFKDSQRVLSYQSVLMILHGTLMVTKQELGALRREAGVPWEEEETNEYTYRPVDGRRTQYGTAPPPAYDQIYSSESKKQIIDGLKKWDREDDTDGRNEIHSPEWAKLVRDDFVRYRGYSESFRKMMAEEVKRRDKERHSAAPRSLSTGNLEHQNAMAEEIRRRRLERMQTHT